MDTQVLTLDPAIYRCLQMYVPCLALCGDHPIPESQGWEAGSQRCSGHNAHVAFHVQTEEN